jgi:hypothetical protein
LLAWVGISIIALGSNYVEKITTITHEFDHFIKSPKTINIFFVAKFHQETK